MKTSDQEKKLVTILESSNVRISNRGNICLNDFVENVIESKNADLYMKKINDKKLLDDNYYIKPSHCIDILKQGKSKKCKEIVQFIEKDENDTSSIIDPKEHIFQYEGHKFLAFFIDDDENDNWQVWIKGSDVAKYLGYKDYKQAIRDHVEKQNLYNIEKLFELFSNLKKTTIKYMNKQTKFINYEGLLQLVAYSRKPKSIGLGNFLGFHLTHKKTYHEMDIMNNLMKFFNASNIKYITPFTVTLNHKKIYLIDCYLPEYHIAVEIDEHNHHDRDPIYEMKRERDLIKKLNCVFVRCNPDDAEYSTYELIGRIHKLILANN